MGSIKVGKFSKKSGFTLIEMLIGFFLSMFILSVFYFMHGTYQIRLIKVIHKARGQQAVRLFMTKIRQELKGATKIYIPKGPKSADEQEFPYEWRESRSDVIFIQMGRTNIRDYPGFTVMYEYVQDKKAIRFREFQRQGGRLVPLREGIFLGGNTQILGFHASQTDSREQILIQKHKVDIELEYFDIVKPGAKKDGHEMVIPLSSKLTVYPRPINMLLRIDVPQG